MLSQDATIMFVGLLTLTASWGVTENGWVICYVWSLLFHGVGLGSEDLMTESYLLSSSGAKLNNDFITVPSTVPISATSHTHYAVKVYSSPLTSTVYDCMLCIKRYYILKPHHGLYKPASQRSLPMRSSQRSLMTTFPYLMQPCRSSPRSFSRHGLFLRP
jgi:hypothetical protein